MNSTSNSPETRQLGGATTVWHHWRPEGELKGALFFLHGQGDFAQRYAEIAAIFTAEGYAFTTCDLPGHGLAPGIRGHIPSFDIVKQVAEQGLREARELAPHDHQLIGLCGHSVGGLLTLSVLPTLDTPPDFSWVSSPLLVAEAGQAPWKQTLLRPLSHILPFLTVSTGVTADMCRVYLPGESATKHLLFHNRISLSWGRTLIDLGQALRAHPERLPNETTYLLTQGGQDFVCPDKYWKELVTHLSLEQLTTRHFPEARHEPFADTQADEVFTELKTWIRTLS